MKSMFTSRSYTQYAQLARERKMYVLIKGTLGNQEKICEYEWYNRSYTAWRTT